LRRLTKTLYEQSLEKTIVLEISATQLVMILFVLLLILLPAGLSFFLAKHKGRNVGLWTVLGLIPYLNLIFLLYFIFAANTRLEAKHNDALGKLGAQE
jgi:hypothetical protein